MNLPRILALDVSGTPSHWMGFEEYASQYCKGNIAWAFGDDGFVIRGGLSRMSGEQSKIDMSSIVSIRGLNASRGKNVFKAPRKVVSTELFRRDHRMCAYCGEVHHEDVLQMEHVHPESRGGQSSWANLVTSCSRCNNFKRDRTPEEAGMQLLYVPYEPTRAEWLILSNRKILADQMEFLLSRCPDTSRAHQLKAA
jgi:hypothetical protein